MVTIKAATKVPLLAVGAISAVAARAVSSLMPAPIPDRTMPQIKMFIVWEVDETIIPRIRKLQQHQVWRRIDARSDPTRRPQTDKWLTRSSGPHLRGLDRHREECRQTNTGGFAILPKEKPLLQRPSTYVRSCFARSHHACSQVLCSRLRLALGILCR